MDGPKKRVPAAFYETPAGSEPVRDWLRSLPKEDRMVIGEAIKRVEFGWPLGMPLCRSLETGLWEVRSSLEGGRIARVIFTLRDSTMVLLHGFIKKTQKTPKSELDVARKRKRELE